MTTSRAEGDASIWLKKRAHSSGPQRVRAGSGVEEPDRSTQPGLDSRDVLDHTLAVARDIYLFALGKIKRFQPRHDPGLFHSSGLESKPCPSSRGKGMFLLGWGRSSLADRFPLGVIEKDTSDAAFILDLCKLEIAVCKQLDLVDADWV